MYIIITVTYNDKDNLSATIDSVRKYKIPSQKFYIIDGNSKDGSDSLINNNLDIIDGVISESDKGIYDAMNKALNFPISDDDFLFWLNAGDLLLPWEGYEFDDSVDSIFSSIIKKSDRIVQQKGFICNPEIYTPYNIKNFYPKSKYQHQGFMIKKSLFRQFKYDTSIGLQAENLLMSQAILKGNFAVYNYPISIYYTDGVSNSKTISVLWSYIKVARKLGFSLFNIMFFKFIYFLKAIIYDILPPFIKDIYNKKKFK